MADHVLSRTILVIPRLCTLPFRSGLTVTASSSIESVRESHVAAESGPTDDLSPCSRRQSRHQRVQAARDSSGLPQ